MISRERGKSGIRAVLVFGAVLAVAGCQGGVANFFSGDGSGGEASEDGAQTPSGATRLVERDVEAPEVFQVTESGLWDGRPSLGGVWVAHPDATDPERVIIRNTDNERFVIGALFRRERDNPGPELQVSSDAAAALNILAGQPTQLNVTALRRAEAPPPLPEPATEEAEVAAATTTGEIQTQTLDPIAAAASAAIDESEAAAPSAPAPAAATPAPAPAPAASAPPAASSLERPFIQIGIFSVEENANNTAQAMRTAGLVPTVYEQTSNNRRFWRVVVGPARNTSERATLLDTVQGLGFEDAYSVTN